MSFATLQTSLSPLKKTFEEIVQTLTLPSVLPPDIEALKTLLVAQQTAHLAVVQALHLEAHDYVIRMLEQARAGTPAHVWRQLRAAVGAEPLV